MNQSDFKEWKGQPSTDKYLEFLKLELEDKKTQLMNLNGFSNAEQIAIAYVELRGECNVLEELINLKAEDFNDE